MTIEERRKRKKELESEIERVEGQLKEIGTSRTAAADDDWEDLSEYEKALETKGTKPAPYMTELPKPKGWDVIENFFREAKRERRVLDEIKKERKDVPPMARNYIAQRLRHFEKMIPAIDAYKKQIVNIGGDTVKLEDTVLRFEKLLLEYQNKFIRYFNERDEAIDRAVDIRKKIKFLEDLFDPETGEFKGMAKEEIENLKKVFLRMLYKEIESYWATQVGKNISVFGERDTEWYNNVYRTFKNLASVRGNKKYLGLISRLKQETRSDFDDVVNRLKSSELEKRMEFIIKRYRELGGNPDKSESLDLLKKRIEALKSKEDQIKKIFNEMAEAVQVGIDSKLEESLSEKFPGKPRMKVDLKKRMDEETDDVISIMDREFVDILGADKDLKKVETILEKGEEKLGIDRDKVSIEEVFRSLEGISTLSSEVIQDSVDKYKKGQINAEKATDLILNNLDNADYHTRPQDKIRKYVKEHGNESLVKSLSETPVEKIAYNKLHKDYNHRILYGSVLQGKIQELLVEDMKRSRN